MLGRTEYNKTRFNRSSEAEARLSATLKAGYALSARLRVQIRLPDTTVSAIGGMEAELHTYVPLGEDHIPAEYSVEPLLGAKIPLGEICIASEYGVSATLGVKVPLGVKTISAVYTVVPALSVYAKLTALTVPFLSGFQNTGLKELVPLAGVRFDGEYGGYASLHAKVPLPRLVMPSAYRLQAPRPTSLINETMTLEGLDLKPGQTLVIDTDTLDISIDGELRVDCWVTGGTFFKLLPGDNHLRFTDNASSRKLSTTVLWADRYL